MYPTCPDCGSQNCTAFDDHEDATMFRCNDCNTEFDHYYEDDSEEYDPFNSDAEADADVLRSAGWGTDEDYGSASDEY